MLKSNLKFLAVVAAFILLMLLGVWADHRSKLRRCQWLASIPPADIIRHGEEWDRCSFMIWSEQHP